MTISRTSPKIVGAPAPSLPPSSEPNETAPRAESGLGPVRVPRRSSSTVAGCDGGNDRVVTAVVLGAAGGAILLGSMPAEAAIVRPQIAVDSLVASHESEAVVLASIADIGETIASLDLVALPLTGGVGTGKTNAEADVTKVQERLHELGFSVEVDGAWGGETRRALQLFESIVTGAEDVSDTTGVVIADGGLHKALRSPVAPKWVKIPASGVGWTNGDTDHHSYASDRLVSVIEDAGARYSASYLATHEAATPITTNDASKKFGGDTTDHETHEAGLDLDLRLPRKDGTSGTKTTWSSYDRAAAYEMVAAFAQDARVTRVLISDSVMLETIAGSDVPWKGKVEHGGASHKSHIHVDVSPPSLTVAPVIEA